SDPPTPYSFPTRRSSDLNQVRLMIAYRKYFEPGSVALKKLVSSGKLGRLRHIFSTYTEIVDPIKARHWQLNPQLAGGGSLMDIRSEEHTSELQSPDHLVC